MAKYIYTCFACGFPIAFEETECPDKCPGCGAPASQFLREPWTGDISKRRIHVDPPEPDNNRDIHHIKYHPPKHFDYLQGENRIRRWITTYDDPKEARRYYEEAFGWDIVELPSENKDRPILFCATGPGTRDWEMKAASMGFGYLIPKEMGLPGHSYVIDVRDLKQKLPLIEQYGGKVLKEHFVFDNQNYALIEDSEGQPVYLWEIKDPAAPKTTYLPNRAPKKFPEKSLHGRTRYIFTFYKDLYRYIEFYGRVFEWDFLEGPTAMCGLPEGSEHPVLIVCTGETQIDGEGMYPGYMNLNAAYAPGELQTCGLFTEISMDVPLKDSLQKLEALNGRFITDKNENFYAKDRLMDYDNWECEAALVDTQGNYFYLWKCPTSRTWEEPETYFDQQ